MSKIKVSAKEFGTIVSSVYFGANGARVGGYSGQTNDGDSVSADFLAWEDLIPIAKEAGLKWVHLAGDWSVGEFAKYNYKGFGQRIPLSKMRKIVNEDELIKYRRK